MSEKAKNILIIILGMTIVILLGIIIYNVTNDNSASRKNDYSKDTEVDKENVDIENEILKNYELENISNIVINKPCSNCAEPDYDTIVINNGEDIKQILKSIDDAVSIGTLEEGIGLENLFNIEVNYNGDPTTSIIFMDNGNVAINYAVGAGESNYGEYKVSNPNLKKELIEKYF